ncbi:MAG: Mov34/MPN/PAD-1 family protein [Myxococcales bacterium]|nr:Mov34/MPN/PAD-1 family protein [Myxococcales bacterium]
MIEAAVVLGPDRRPLHWHEPVGASATGLPDSRGLWDVLWEHRAELVGVAHTHPGGGEPVPSTEDVTTFAACEAALGRRLEWWIATADQVRCFRHAGPGRTDYAAENAEMDETRTAPWLDELRARSGRWT